MSSPKPRLWLRLAVAILAVVVFFGLIELIVRLAGVDTYFQNRFFVLNRALDYPEIIKKDQDLFWQLRPNREVASQFYEGRSYRINNLGLRGSDVGRKARPRVVALGNSCTFGWGVDDSLTFPTILQQHVPQYEIINAGVPGYSSYQGRVFFGQELVDLQPDIVLVMFSWNDIWAAAGEIADKEQKFPPQPILDIQNQLSRLHSYRLLRKLLLASVEPPTDSLFSRTEPVYRVSREDFKANLTAICSTATVHDCSPILMTAPIASTQLRVDERRTSGMHRFHESYNAITRHVALEMQVGLIDLGTLFERERGLFDDPRRDPMHFNAAGHRYAAEAIRSYLEDSLKIGL